MGGETATGPGVTEAFESRVFESRGPLGLYAGLALGGAALLYVVAAVLFAIGVSMPATPERKFEPGLNGFFMMLLGSSIYGTFLVIQAVFLLRQTRRVMLDALGVSIETSLAKRHVRWAEIAQVSREKRTALYSSAEVLRLQNSAGRCVATITDKVQDFETLSQLLMERSAAEAGHATFDAATNEKRRVGKEVRRSRRLAWAFLVFTLLMSGGFAAGVYEEVHTRRYATEGVEVEASVVRTWMVSVTPWVEYSFQDEGGKEFRREAMMYPGAEWEKVKGAKNVKVQYVRSAPEWNRLVKGEDADAGFGGKVLWLMAFGVLMFGTFCVVSFLGYDLRTENGVTTLVRRGEVVRRWG